MRAGTPPWPGPRAEHPTNHTAAGAGRRAARAGTVAARTSQRVQSRIRPQVGWPSPSAIYRFSPAGRRQRRSRIPWPPPPEGDPPTEWRQVMAKKRRKTLVVCTGCHETIHSGKPSRSVTK
ncbi:hypothetical protein [Kitasatospora sp. NPDC091207]|uniref:HNH endonuclease n=1 Tax=Kitasatospora sp. NPDC091207 TaxID=3364083 RepID=UPI00381B31D4